MTVKDGCKGNASFRPTVAIALGAIAGALGRYYLGRGITGLLGTEFPYGTLTVNVTGCLMMGFLATILLSKSLRAYPELRLFLTTGFLGSYTTFSGYERETSGLLGRGELDLSLLYGLGSIVLGFVALKGGIAAAKLGLTDESKKL